MKRIAVGTAIAVAVLALTMIGAGGAFSWGGTSEHCLALIQAQEDRDVMGHGSKNGAYGPTNCDHSFGGPSAY